MKNVNNALYAHSVCRIDKIIPVLNYAPRHEDNWESGGTALCILNLGTRRRCGQLHVPAALLPTRSPRYLQDKSLGGRLDAVTKRKILAACLFYTNILGERQVLVLSAS